MNTQGSLTGRCLCGSITFTATPANKTMDVCHCAMCRRWSAGPYFAVAVGSSLKMEGERNLGIYPSSDWGERCFCKTCGSTLMWRMRDGSHTSVSAHAFDDPSVFDFVSEIFIDEKPGNYAFAGERPRKTGAELIAAFEAQQIKDQQDQAP